MDAMPWYVPLLICLARICDVSIGTVRIITVIRGRKLAAAMLGFFEVVIWVFAVSAVISYISKSLWAVVFYGLGFAIGTLVGMLIEEKLALGNQMIRIVNVDASLSVASFLRGKNLRVTEVEGRGASGDHELCFVVVPRKKGKRVIRGILKYCPRAFITVEDIRSITSATDIFAPPPSQLPVWKRLVKYR